MAVLWAIQQDFDVIKLAVVFGIGIVVVGAAVFVAANLKHD